MNTNMIRRIIILLIVRKGMDKLLARIGIWQNSALCPFQRVLTVGTKL